MQPTFSVITPTGHRPECFQLLQRWLANQTRQDFEWIVVTDESSAITFDNVHGWFDRHEHINTVFANRDWQPGQNTLARNIALGLEHVQTEHVVICEDDDYYAPDWFERLSHERDCPLVGESPTRYYHIPTSGYRVMPNMSGGAALMCTAVNGADMINLFRDVCRRPSATHLDVRLWRAWGGEKRLINSELCVGIKGMPGRAGLGQGHHPDQIGYTSDPDGRVLSAWLGDDADHYLAYRRSPVLA